MLLILAICPGGKEFNMTETQCVSCGVGTYKPEEDRFGTCINCPANFTTDGNMKMAKSDCNIRKFILQMKLSKQIKTL